MVHPPPKRNMSQNLIRLIDWKQSEVKWAIVISTIIEALLIILHFRMNFTTYEGDICNLIQCIITGLIGLIGVAIAGIAIVIALFVPQQIKMIDDLLPGAFDTILYDFKWFALIATIEVAVNISVFFIIKSPYPVAPALIFYTISIFLIYGVFYLLFYGCALVSNFIKLSRIKCTLDDALAYYENLPTNAIQLELDLLISKFYPKDKDAVQKFKAELIQLVERSSFNNKSEIINYINSRKIDI